MSSLYLHIPFCRSKCPYCDFYSQVGNQQQLDDYVELLVKHLQFLGRQEEETLPLKTIFFGGGTPSLLSGGQVGRLLFQLDQTFGITKQAEISLEANPGTLDRQKLQGYRSAGVNRLSLGVQSLSEQRLQLLGRSHTTVEARDAVVLARAAGFSNLNLDLMFSLPGQDCASLDQELSELLALAPEHVSLYGLSFEEGTDFTARKTRGELSGSTEEESAAQYRLLHERMVAAGFEHYEISNFARPDNRCRHNQVYWQRRSCLAVGCGAHAFCANDWGERRYVPPDSDLYRQQLLKGKDPSESLEVFDRKAAMAETVYLALRTSDGLDRRAFQSAFGSFPEEVFLQAFAALEGQLQLDADNWRFGLDGWLIYDHLITHFL